VGALQHLPVTRGEGIRRLAAARFELASLGVPSLDLVGSLARGESGPDSDVNLLVDFDVPIGLFHRVQPPRRTSGRAIRLARYPDLMVAPR